MRFVRYEWHRSWWSPPVSVMPKSTIAKEEGPFFRTNYFQASKGGDLTAMLGVEAAKLPFLEERLPGIQIQDHFGYPNRVYDPEQSFDAVVVGDSFAGVGFVDELFASQLADSSGLSVYNMGIMGHGAFAGLEHFLKDERFVRHPPRYLVWAFAQREIGGHYFERFRARLNYQRSAPVPVVDQLDRQVSRGGRVDWNALSPPRLKESLPKSSFTAQAMQWLWTRIRYYVFHQLSPWVVASDGLVGDGPMLFYHYHIETLKWPASERDVPTVAEVIGEVAFICAEREIELVVVLIPEKEEVYRDWIPATYQPRNRVWPPSPLAPLAALLDEKGVEALDLLPVFQRATESGKVVYWRDDTHWNPLGAGLAARQLAGMLSVEAE